ncbi:MAG: hypothetical protein R3F43_03930 [bacterium]
MALGVDATVVVGADAQMDPAEMASLLDPIADGEADYVKGIASATPRCGAACRRCACWATPPCRV